MAYYVYVLASQPRGALYIGVNNNVLRQHTEQAIQRENPYWKDLYERMCG